MQNKKFNYLLFTVLIGWILLLIPARFRQIESFSNFKANSLSYYLIYNEKIDIPINKTIFFFGEVKNHAALETFLAGYKTVPVGIYPIHSFKKFFNFQNIVSNQFMLKDRNSDFYSIYDY